ncbi:hypothetical protein CFN78_06980 [Amycolatopsis antarctica]|uniref:Uncharacterized protein n=1 Tax=Amycolatopsis antarctica TaxID=1854586 RepID=A0A263D9H5_9PSEU|nr:hypothetical protein [Amycolatopsis antarctica]OZM74025.1 hypothetical protein CFN78_06980 [Amycolatopsis antarctica]
MSTQDFPSWYQYVQRRLDQLDMSTIAFEDKTGVSRTRLHGWKTGGAVRPDIVRVVAEALDLPILQAFVVAGFLKPDEVGQTAAAPIDPMSLSNDEILGEVRRRMDAAEGGAGPRFISREEIEAAGEDVVTTPRRARSRREA